MEWIIKLVESTALKPKTTFYKYEIGGILHDSPKRSEALEFITVEGASIVANFIEGNYDYCAFVIES